MAIIKHITETVALGGPWAVVRWLMTEQRVSTSEPLTAAVYAAAHLAAGT